MSKAKTMQESIDQFVAVARGRSDMNKKGRIKRYQGLIKTALEAGEVFDNMYKKHKMDARCGAYVMARLPLDIMVSNPTYQSPIRTETPKRLKKMVEMSRDWQPILAGYPIVSPWPENSTIVVVDGHARTNAAFIAGVEYMDCKMLLDGLEMSTEDRIKWEAEIFRKQATGTTPITMAHSFAARVVEGDQIARGLDVIMLKYNLKFCETYGAPAAGYIAGVEQLYKIAGTPKGLDNIDFTLATLFEIGYNNYHGGKGSGRGLGQHIIQPLVGMVNQYHEEAQRLEVCAILATYMKHYTPKDVLKHTRIMFPELPPDNTSTTMRTWLELIRHFSSATAELPPSLDPRIVEVIQCVRPRMVDVPIVEQHIRAKLAFAA